MITVKVTGTKTGYATVIKESVPTAAVALGDLTLSPVPTIGGAPTFGETLTATAGAWDPGTSLAYEWRVDGAPQVPAGATYAVRAGDVGKVVTVAVTGSKPGYHPVTRASLGTAPVAAASLGANQCTVDLKGRAKVGKKLTAKLVDCPAGATLRYVWYAGTKRIKGATGATYKIQGPMAGKRIKVLVSVSLPGYLSVPRASPPTKKVRD